MNGTNPLSNANQSIDLNSALQLAYVYPDNAYLDAASLRHMPVTDITSFLCSYACTQEAAANLIIAFSELDEKFTETLLLNFFDQNKAKTLDYLSRALYEFENKHDVSSPFLKQVEQALENRQPPPPMFNAKVIDSSYDGTPLGNSSQSIASRIFGWNT